MKKNTYTGRLGKPRPFRRFPPMLLRAPEEAEECLRKWHAEEQQERTVLLAELCAVHNVPTGDYMALLYAMLETHVPAWRRERAPRGRKPRWTPLSEAELHADVEDIMATHNFTVMSACRALARRKLWIDLLGGGEKDSRAVALSKHYYAADPRIVGMVRYARAAEEMERMYPGLDLNKIDLDYPDALNRAWDNANPGACNPNSPTNSET